MTELPVHAITIHFKGRADGGLVEAEKYINGKWQNVAIFKPWDALVIYAELVMNDSGSLPYPLRLLLAPLHMLVNGLRYVVVLGNGCYLFTIVFVYKPWRLAVRKNAFDVYTPGKTIDVDVEVKMHVYGEDLLVLDIDAITNT
jgi:hypothetical protein